MSTKRKLLIVVLILAGLVLFYWWLIWVGAPIPLSAPVTNLADGIETARKALPWWTNGVLVSVAVHLDPANLSQPKGLQYQFFDGTDCHLVTLDNRLLRAKRRRMTLCGGTASEPPDAETN